MRNTVVSSLVHPRKEGGKSSNDDYPTGCLIDPQVHLALPTRTAATRRQRCAYIVLFSACALPADHWQFSENDASAEHA